MSRSTASDDSAPDPKRLQKVLAACGLGSRRHCEQYILAGRVDIDGQVVQELGARVDPRVQKITVDGERIRPGLPMYFLLNKPPGYLCTNRDPSGRQRVVDLLRKEHKRLFTVGRLDVNSQGLLLVTNDGDLGNRLTHPRYQIPKTYRVQVAGTPERETLDLLRHGLRFAEGMFRVQDIRRVGTQGKSTFLEIVLKEGQNRVIRRLLARVGHKTISLERIAFGPLKLGRLPIGEYRPLRQPELKSLLELSANSGRRRQASKTGGRQNRNRTPVRDPEYRKLSKKRGSANRRTQSKSPASATQGKRKQGRR